MTELLHWQGVGAHHQMAGKWLLSASSKRHHILLTTPAELTQGDHPLMSHPVESGLNPSPQVADKTRTTWEPRGEVYETGKEGDHPLSGIKR